MKILLLGANGQLGKSVVEFSTSENWPIGWKLLAWDRVLGDLAKPDELVARVADQKPDVIINAAAYTKVDQAEKERALCEVINATAPAKLAEYCAKKKVTLVHYSTDYVYAGTGDAAHYETDPIAPNNFYGKTKGEGDQAIEKSGSDYLIFRTSWVYSHTGKNFVLTMLKLGAEMDSLKVVNDQIGSPSYAPDLAKYSLDALMKALEQKVEGKRFPSGVYHLCNSGVTSWCDFAKAILPGKNINGIPSSEYPTPAKRPLNSRLSLKKLVATFGLKPRPWQEALADCLKQVKKAQ